MNKQNSTAIEQAVESEIVQQNVGSIEAISRNIGDRIKIVDRVHSLLNARIVPERDIKVIGGKPRRTINFARICRRIVGGDVTYRRDPKTDLPYRKIDQQDEQGRFYTYTCSCVWSLPWGERVEGIGMVSSRNPFLGIENDEFKDVGDVNETHIAQFCVTEAFKQAIFVGLGFPKDITKEELLKYGIDSSKAGGHDFNSARGAQGGSKDGSQETKDNRAEIGRLCRELFEAGYKDEKGVEPIDYDDVLRMATKNDSTNWPGWKAVAKISEKSLARTLHDVKEVHTKFMADKG